MPRPVRNLIDGHRNFVLKLGSRVLQTVMAPFGRMNQGGTRGRAQEPADGFWSGHEVRTGREVFALRVEHLHSTPVIPSDHLDLSIRQNAKRGIRAPGVHCARGGRKTQRCGIEDFRSRKRVAIVVQSSGDQHLSALKQCRCVEGPRSDLVRTQ